MWTSTDELRIPIVAYIGTAEFARFHVDLVAGIQWSGCPEHALPLSRGPCHPRSHTADQCCIHSTCSQLGSDPSRTHAAGATAHARGSRMESGPCASGPRRAATGGARSRLRHGDGPQIHRAPSWWALRQAYGIPTLWSGPAKVDRPGMWRSRLTRAWPAVFTVLTHAASMAEIARGSAAVEDE
jgi:hypothetical protein